MKSLQTTQDNTIFYGVKYNRDEIYFTCYKGLGHINLHTHKFSYYNTDVSQFGYFPLGIAYVKDTEKIVYFSTPTTLTFFSPESKSFYNKVVSEYGYCIKLVKNKQISYIGKDTQLLYVNLKQTSVNCTQYDIDKKNMFWCISGDKTLVRYNPYQHHAKTIDLYGGLGNVDFSVKTTKNKIFTSSINIDDGSFKQIVSVDMNSFKVKYYDLVSPSPSADPNDQKIISTTICARRYLKTPWILATSADNHTGVYVYDSKTKTYNLTWSIGDTTKVIGIVIRHQLYVYIYLPVNGLDPNKYICKINEDGSVYSDEVFTDSKYQYTGTDDNQYTDQCIDQFIGVNKQMYFISSYKVINDQDVNINAINWIVSDD